MEQLEKYQNLARQVVAIYESSLDWENKYHLIFSKGLAKQIYMIKPVDYWDPNSTYEEDVRAYVVALVKQAEL